MLPTSMRPRADRWSRRGLTLIELMISLLIASFVIAGGLAVFLSSSRLLQNDTMLSNTQESARLALDTLAEDVRRTGIGGMAPQLARASGLVTYPAMYSWHRPAQNGGAASDVLQLVVALPERRLSLQQAVSPASALAQFGCGPRAINFSANELIFLTDLHSGVIEGGLDAGCTAGSVLSGTTIPVPLATTASSAVAALATSALAMPAKLLRFDVETGSDGTPFLAQTTLALELGQAGQTTSLVRGIESFTIAYGQDTNGDGMADTWSTDPPGGAPPAGLDLPIPSADPPAAAPTALANVVALRLTVTARTSNPVATQAQPGPAPTSPAAPDGYVRRTLTMDVPIRNGHAF